MILLIDDNHYVESDSSRNWTVKSRKGRIKSTSRPHIGDAIHFSHAADLATGLIRHGLIDPENAQTCAEMYNHASAKARELGEMKNGSCVVFASGRFTIAPDMTGSVLLQNPSRDVPRIKAHGNKTVGYCVDIRHALTLAVWSALTADQRTIPYTDFNAVAAETAREMLTDAAVLDTRYPA
jgi:hypothetical protein